jgi:hypothetical protein
MSRISKILAMICSGILLMGMSGCATAQVASDPVVEVQRDTIMAVADTLPPMASEYQWLSYRGKADIVDTGGTRTCNFFFVNRVDSIIYLNVSAYGVEVIRAVLTPDSIKYVNKLTYQYYAGTYAPLRLLLKRQVDFALVQDIFQGYGDERLEHGRFSCEYHDFAAVDSTRSFFTELVLKDMNQLVEINAHLKVIRFDVPGPTGIRIPDKFQELKL